MNRSSIASWPAVASAKAACAKHNLEKSDKILSIAPWIFASAAAASPIQALPDDVTRSGIELTKTWTIE